MLLAYQINWINIGDFLLIAKSVQLTFAHPLLLMSINVTVKINVNKHCSQVFFMFFAHFLVENGI